MRAMIFAAGLGTRLRPLTDERPKPGVPVANRALASLAVAHLASAGARHVVVNTFHLGERLPALMAAHVPAGLRVTYVQEARLLGTGGGLRNAQSALLEGAAQDEVVVVMNGDVVFAPDLERAIAHHRATGAVATMIVRATPGSEGHGAVEIDAERGRVGRIHQLPVAAAAGLVPVTFTGVHVLSQRAFAELPAEGCIVRTAYRRWIDAGVVVGAVLDESPWRDLGTLREYIDGNLELASGRLASPYVVPSADGTLVAEGARVHESARLAQCVIGAGAVIDAGVTLERVVVWDGAHVTQSARDAVVWGLGKRTEPGSFVL